MSNTLDTFASALVEEDSNHAKKILGDERDLLKRNKIIFMIVSKK